jgi:hypothetical protein
MLSLYYEMFLMLLLQVFVRLYHRQIYQTLNIMWKVDNKVKNWLRSGIFLLIPSSEQASCTCLFCITILRCHGDLTLKYKNIWGQQNSFYPNFINMTQEAIQQQIDAIKKANEDARKTPESAVKFLVEAGIISNSVVADQKEKSLNSMLSNSEKPK